MADGSSKIGTWKMRSGYPRRRSALDTNRDGSEGETAVFLLDRLSRVVNVIAATSGAIKPRSDSICLAVRPRIGCTSIHTTSKQGLCAVTDQAKHSNGDFLLVPIPRPRCQIARD